MFRKCYNGAEGLAIGKGLRDRGFGSDEVFLAMVAMGNP
jgi:hypothetical protein